MKMYKIIGLISAFFCALSVTTAANAVPIVDTINQNIFVDFQSPYTYTHDLNDNGFILGSAASGTISINFSDDLISGVADPEWEAILIVVENFLTDTGGILGSVGVFNNGLQVDALAQINSFGTLDITISSLYGDFYVGQSVLTVQTAQVPEPAILGLLGLGFLGLGLVRRLRKS